jgi:hypothetical protein
VLPWRATIDDIAIATDRKANHARTKCLKQHLGIGRVVAEIGYNNSIGIIAAIDPRECAGTRTSV